MIDRWGLVAPVCRGGGASPVQAPPTLSVVVAAYQAEATIGAAIESALSQSSAAHEIIVCDDGSTDRTADIVHSFGSAVQLIRQENRGESAAKNTAVGAARGDFVVVLDADDTFAPRRLEALAWLAGRRPDLDVLVTNANIVVEGEVIGTAYHSGWPFEIDDQPREILRRNFILGLSGVRRSRWLELAGFDESVRLTADWDFFIRLLRSGSRAGLVDAPLAEYRLRSGTLSSDRISLVQSRIGTLERARDREALTLDELAVVQEALDAQRRELLTRRARAALVARSPDRRRRLLAIARDGGFGWRRRGAALLGAGAPTPASLWLRRQSRRTVELGTGARGRA